ncbi:MAG: hypothetical protein K6G15_03710 [Desulfovibrio sp.]|nr:hypothetical protein [Desulfovibrio sp.]
MPRKQYLFVAIAKHLFYHERYGLVRVWDPIHLKQAPSYGLQPFLLYAVVVEHLPIRWISLTPKDQPRPLMDVLCEAWREGFGLRGCPDVLIVNRHIAKASPKLAENLAKIGVTLKVADGHDRKPPRLMGVAQGVIFELFWNKKKKEGNLEEALTILQELSRQHHQNSCQPLRGYLSMQQTDKLQHWLELPKREVPPWTSEGMDWEGGKWLQSWEQSIPPIHEHFFKKDLNESFYTLVGGSKAEDERRMAVEDVQDRQDAVARLSKLVASCSHYRLVVLAQHVGCTKQQLEWFFSDQFPLDLKSRQNLIDLFKIVFNPETGCLELSGPYFLEPINGAAFKEIAEFFVTEYDGKAFECLPQEGETDATWRYYLLKNKKSILMMVRADRQKFNTKRLPRILADFIGERQVPKFFYDDLVQTCARACLDPESNTREVLQFEKRHKAYLKSIRL